MDGSLLGESSHHGMAKSGHNSHDNLEELDCSGSRWYFSRKEIEENSPSRRDGIDLKKETYLRKSYCTFLQDLGMRLKVPQVTIATAIIFCHRFFLHQSHVKNDRRTIATVCMFLAGKVEETPRPLKDVILVSYEIIHKKDPSAVQRIKQKEVYEEQKELILIGERLVLATLAFEFNVHHPYKPLVEAIKKFKVAQNALAQVAWNFVNDGLRTSLCLQYKPHHIAAGAIFLAAKFLKVKLPSDGEKVWWQEFDVTPRQLEDVSNQMLELYEQNKSGQTSHASEIEGSTIGGSHQPVFTTSTVTENSVSVSGSAQNSGVNNARQGGQVIAPMDADSNSNELQIAQKQIDGNRSLNNKSGVWDHHKDSYSNDCLPHEVEGISNHQEIALQTSRYSKSTSDVLSRDDTVNERGLVMEAKDWKDEAYSSKSCNIDNRISSYGEGDKGFSQPDAMAKIDKDRVKAALEKRRKLHNVVVRKNDITDDDDLIERELENGIKLSVDDGKTKQDGSHGRLDSQLFEQAGNRTTKIIKGSDHHYLNGKSMSNFNDSEDSILLDDGQPDLKNAEEGELSSLHEQRLPSSKHHSSSRKATTIRHSSDEHETTKLDSLKRNRNEYEYPSKLAGEQVVRHR